MTIYRFDTLEDYLAFVNQAHKDGLRPLLRHGLQVEVPDGYDPNAKVEVAESEPEEDLQAEANEAVEAYERNLAEGVQEQVVPPTTPARNASRDTWADYAKALGLDPTDKSRDDIIKMVEGV